MSSSLISDNMVHLLQDFKLYWMQVTNLDYQHWWLILAILKTFIYPHCLLSSPSLWIFLPLQSTGLWAGLQARWQENVEGILNEEGQLYMNKWNELTDGALFLTLGSKGKLRYMIIVGLIITGHMIIYLIKKHQTNQGDLRTFRAGFTPSKIDIVTPLSTNIEL